MKLTMQNRATVRQVLRASGLTSLEARILLGHVLQVSPAWIVAHQDDTLDETAVQRFNALVAQRRDGVPIAYLVGEREFWGLLFKVTPSVLIPRPDTETLVEAALRFLPEMQDARVLDLGTGSGAVAVAIAHERRQAQVLATDVSPTALQIAQENGARLLGADEKRIAWRLSNWFEAIPLPEREIDAFDVVVSNPPYIAAADTHLSDGDVRFEPRGALISGTSGLDALRAIIEQAPHYLKPGGVLLLEHGYDQAEAVEGLLCAAGLTQRESVRDLAGTPRVALGRWMGFS